MFPHVDIVCTSIDKQTHDDDNATSFKGDKFASAKWFYPKGMQAKYFDCIQQANNLTYFVLLSLQRGNL